MKGYYASLLRQARGDAPMTMFAPEAVALTDRVTNTANTLSNSVDPVTLAEAMGQAGSIEARG